MDTKVEPLLSNERIALLAQEAGQRLPGLLVGVSLLPIQEVIRAAVEEAAEACIKVIRDEQTDYEDTATYAEAKIRARIARV